MSRTNAQNKVAPQLRFPEFRDRPAWSPEPIGTYLTESRERGNTGDEARKLTVKLWGKGVFEKDERLQGSANTQYFVRRAGQFIYSKLDFLNQAFGIIPEHLDGFESTVDLPCFDIAEGLDRKFLLEYVCRPSFFKRVGEIADGGRKARRIQVDTFLGFPLLLPPDLPEQQKIAECLGSLDDLIAAEGRKLEALREHKKGLMQQLFPREGETQPRLRFSEFQDGLDWKVRPLAQVAENLDNRRVPITENDRTKGEIPYYGASGIVDYVDDYLFDEDLLCISEDGANLLARTYPIAFSISGKTWVNNHAHVLRFGDRARQTLVEAYLNMSDLRDFITGMAQPKLNRGMLDSIPIPLPHTSEEEKCIADSLSALDTLVAAQSEKLAALRTHKRGLMQQLFPSPEELQA